MLYLLDANTLITAKNDYYQLERVPEFWDWLIHHAKQGSVKVPPEIFNEIRRGTDDLAVWIKQAHVESALLLQEEVDPALLQKILDTGYAPNLTDVELEKIGMDPFLMAYSLRDTTNRMVISGEVSAPRKERANRKVPDVCKTLGIQCKNVFTLVSNLNFSTNWNATP